MSLSATVSLFILSNEYKHFCSEIYSLICVYMIEMFDDEMCNVVLMLECVCVWV